MKELTSKIPDPKGNPVKIITFFDSYYFHDIETRRYVTGVMMIINKTPIQWYSKSQNIVKTSTYRSEMAATSIATEMTMAMSYNNIIIWVDIYGPTQMLG